MSLFSEAADYLTWEDSKASLRMPLPIMEVVLPSSLSDEEKALVEKILQSLPFEVAGFERVQKPRVHFCIDFTGQFQDVVACAAVSELVKDPEKKKALWQKLLEGSPSRRSR